MRLLICGWCKQAAHSLASCPACSTRIPRFHQLFLPGEPPAAQDWAASLRASYCGSTASYGSSARPSCGGELPGRLPTATRAPGQRLFSSEPPSPGGDMSSELPPVAGRLEPPRLPSSPSRIPRPQAGYSSPTAAAASAAALEAGPEAGRALSPLQRSQSGGSRLKLLAQRALQAADPARPGSDGRPGSTPRSSGSGSGGSSSDGGASGSARRRLPYASAHRHSVSAASSLSALGAAVPRNLWLLGQQPTGGGSAQTEAAGASGESASAARGGPHVEVRRSCFGMR